MCARGLGGGYANESVRNLPRVFLLYSILLSLTAATQAD